jgi:hypothetical protein
MKNPVTKQQAKARKRELIPQLQEAFDRVKTAKTPEDFYNWQDRVEYLAYELKKCEFI